MSLFCDMSDPPDTPTPPVGQQLADRREELDLTQQALAQRIDMTSTTVSATERGRTEISRSNRAAWEQALRLAPGTISRAYKEGTRLQPLAPPTPQEPYADLEDLRERTIWEMNVPEENRRKMIDILRADRKDERRRSA
jgi:transcriptional regulator with XRE-family HTH domain